MPKVFWLVLIAFAQLSLPGFAESLEHPAGVVVWIPDGWDAEFAGDQLTIADDADDAEVVIFFQVLPCEKVAEGIELVDDALAENVSKLVVEDAEVGQLNGMEALRAEGSGILEGQPIELGFLILETPCDQILLVVGLGSKAHLAKHQASVDRVTGSIAPGACG